MSEETTPAWAGQLTFSPDVRIRIGRIEPDDLIESYRCLASLRNKTPSEEKKLGEKKTSVPDFGNFSSTISSRSVSCSRKKNTHTTITIAHSRKSMRTCPGPGRIIHYTIQCTRSSSKQPRIAINPHTHTYAHMRPAFHIIVTLQHARLMRLCPKTGNPSACARACDSFSQVACATRSPPSSFT